MQPFRSEGVYVNELSADENEAQDRVLEAYSPATYHRLVALKNKYDPTNFFRLNPNIKPTVSTRKVMPREPGSLHVESPPA